MLDNHSFHIGLEGAFKFFWNNGQPPATQCAFGVKAQYWCSQTDLIWLSQDTTFNLFNENCLLSGYLLILSKVNLWGMFHKAEVPNKSNKSCTLVQFKLQLRCDLDLNHQLETFSHLFLMKCDKFRADKKKM